MWISGTTIGMDRAADSPISSYACRAISATVSPHGGFLLVSEKRTFAVVLEPEEEGGFTVRVPAITEIVTYGNDEREALAMAQDAIRLVVTDMRARGEA